MSNPAATTTKKKPKSVDLDPNAYDGQLLLLDMFLGNVKFQKGLHNRVNRKLRKYEKNVPLANFSNINQLMQLNMNAVENFIHSLTPLEYAQIYPSIGLSVVDTTNDNFKPVPLPLSDPTDVNNKKLVQGGGYYSTNSFGLKSLEMYLDGSDHPFFSKAYLVNMEFIFDSINTFTSDIPGLPGISYARLLKSAGRVGESNFALKMDIGYGSNNKEIIEKYDLHSPSMGFSLFLNFLKSTVSVEENLKVSVKADYISREEEIFSSVQLYDILALDVGAAQKKHEGIIETNRMKRAALDLASEKIVTSTKAALAQSVQSMKAQIPPLKKQQERISAEMDRRQKYAREHRLPSDVGSLSMKYAELERIIEAKEMDIENRQNILDENNFDQILDESGFSDQAAKVKKKLDKEDKKSIKKLKNLRRDQIIESLDELFTSAYKKGAIHEVHVRQADLKRYYGTAMAQTRTVAQLRATRKNLGTNQQSPAPAAQPAAGAAAPAAQPAAAPAAQPAAGAGGGTSSAAAPPAGAAGAAAGTNVGNALVQGAVQGVQAVAAFFNSVAQGGQPPAASTAAANAAATPVSPSAQPTAVTTQGTVNMGGSGGAAAGTFEQRMQDWQKEMASAATIQYILLGDLVRLIFEKLVKNTAVHANKSKNSNKGKNLAALQAVIKRNLEKGVILLPNAEIDSLETNKVHNKNLFFLPVSIRHLRLIFANEVWGKNRTSFTLFELMEKIAELLSLTRKRKEQVLNIQTSNGSFRLKKRTYPIERDTATELFSNVPINNIQGRYGKSGILFGNKVKKNINPRFQTFIKAAATSAARVKYKIFTDHPNYLDQGRVKSYRYGIVLGIEKFNQKSVASRNVPTFIFGGSPTGIIKKFNLTEYTDDDLQKLVMEETTGNADAVIPSMYGVSITTVMCPIFQLGMDIQVLTPTINVYRDKLNIFIEGMYSVKKIIHSYKGNSFTTNIEAMMKSEPSRVIDSALNKVEDKDKLVMEAANKIFTAISPDIENIVTQGNYSIDPASDEVIFAAPNWTAAAEINEAINSLDDLE